MRLSLPDRTTLRHAAETLLIGQVGGAALQALGVPAGMVSGAIVAVAGAGAAGRPILIPLPVRNVSFILVGASLGAAVTPEMLHGMASYPLTIAILLVGMVAMMAGTASYLHLAHRWDKVSALLGASPGALSQAFMLASENESDMKAIAIVQAFRVMALNFGLPGAIALFGLDAVSGGATMAGRPPAPLTDVALVIAVATASALLLRRLGYPGSLPVGAMIGAAALSGAGFVHGVLPWWIIYPASAALGTLVGASFSNADLRQLLRHAGAGLGSTLVSLAICGAFVMLAIYTAHPPLLELIMSYSPGAQETMMVLALALHLDPIFIGAHQFGRYVFVSFLIPLLIPLLGGRTAKRR